LLRGVSGLVSGLLGGDEQPQQSTSSGEQGHKEISLEDLSPALLRQLKRLFRSKSEED
jgi:hypothetical protein